MELRRYWAIFRKWFWLLVLGTLLAAGASYMVSMSMPPVYRASTTLFVNQASSGSTVPYYDVLTSERLTRTFAELVVKRPVLDKVRENLGLPYSAGGLAGMIKVSLVRDTQLLVVSVENNDPRLARDIADEVAGVFIEQNAAMQVARSSELRRQLDQRLSDIEQEMLGVTQAIEDLGLVNTEGKQSETAKLKASISQLQATYSSILKSRGDLTVAETAMVNSVSVAEPAVEPEAPFSPKPLQNLALAAMLGLVLSLGAGLLLEYLDDTIKNPDDVEATTSLVTLGAITLFDTEEKNSKLLTKDYSKSPISEAYRVLRTNIQFSSLDKPLRSLLVTSANPSEGKSTTAANLAVVVAQTGKKVILVDSDLRRPSLHHFFDVSNQQGLTNLLLADTPDGQDVVQATSVDGLRVLTSGPLPPNPSELLGSHRMERVLEYLQREADLIILDSPPVLSVADPAVLASKVDGVLMVVQAGRTRPEVLKQAKEHLARGEANILGVALNKLNLRRSDYYYQYYYYYSSYSSRDGSDKGRVKKRRHGGSNHVHTPIESKTIQK